MIMDFFKKKKVDKDDRIYFNYKTEDHEEEKE